MRVDITDNSAEVLSEMEAAARRALEKCGLVAEGYAKKLCPVGTPESTGVPGYVGGTLRNSITHAIAGEGAAISSYTDNAGKKKGSYSGTTPTKSEPCVYIGTNVQYSEFVETGTHRMRAQPYLKPAVADHTGEYNAIVRSEMKGG